MGALARPLCMRLLNQLSPPAACVSHTYAPVQNDDSLWHDVSGQPASSPWNPAATDTTSSLTAASTPEALSTLSTLPTLQLEDTLPLGDRSMDALVQALSAGTAASEGSRSPSVSWLQSPLPPPSLSPTGSADRKDAETEGETPPVVVMRDFETETVAPMHTESTAPPQELVTESDPSELLPAVPGTSPTAASNDQRVGADAHELGREWRGPAADSDGSRLDVERSSSSASDASETAASSGGLAGSSSTSGTDDDADDDVNDSDRDSQPRFTSETRQAHYEAELQQLLQLPPGQVSKKVLRRIRNRLSASRCRSKRVRNERINDACDAG